MAAGSAQALNGREVLLAGAGSQVGVFAIPRLRAFGCEVLAVNRSGRPAGVPEIAGVRWLDADGVAHRASACRHLLSAGPLDLAVRLLEAGSGLRRAVVFSSTSVATKKDSPNRAERQVAADMLGLEEKLLRIAGERGVRLTVLRPTLIYGCGLDANISRLARWIVRFGFVPVSGGARGLRQPVHADDLAATAVRALFTERELPPRMDLPGGEILAYDEMVRRIFPALQRPERVLRLPAWLFAALAGAVGMLRPGDGVNADMVRRQSTDLVFDGGPAREFLDYAPRPFRPGASDFSLPNFE